MHKLQKCKQIFSIQVSYPISSFRYIKFIPLLFSLFLHQFRNLHLPFPLFFYFYPFFHIPLSLYLFSLFLFPCPFYPYPSIPFTSVLSLLSSIPLSILLYQYPFVLFHLSLPLYYVTLSQSFNVTTPTQPQHNLS